MRYVVINLKIVDVVKSKKIALVLFCFSLSKAADIQKTIWIQLKEASEPQEVPVGVSGFLDRCVEDVALQNGKENPIFLPKKNHLKSALALLIEDCESSFMKKEKKGASFKELFSAVNFLEPKMNSMNAFYIAWLNERENYKQPVYHIIPTLELLKRMDIDSNLVPEILMYKYPQVELTKKDTCRIKNYQRRKHRKMSIQNLLDRGKCFYSIKERSPRVRFEDFEYGKGKYIIFDRTDIVSLQGLKNVPHINEMMGVKFGHSSVNWEPIDRYREFLD